jgi:hypothetical protein
MKHFQQDLRTPTVRLNQKGHGMQKSAIRMQFCPGVAEARYLTVDRDRRLEPSRFSNIQIKNFGGGQRRQRRVAD